MQPRTVRAWMVRERRGRTGEQRDLSRKRTTHDLVVVCITHGPRDSAGSG